MISRRARWPTTRAKCWSSAWFLPSTRPSATRRFNTEAAKLSDNVRILTISCDLPFAQTRWCGAAGVDAVETLSDHRDLSFGTAYGVAIKELRLLSRAVFVICANGVIAYEQIVKEVTHDVDFEAALGAVKACLEK